MSLLRLQLFLKPTPLNVHMAEAHLQTPPVFMWEQKQRKKKENKKKLHPQISMWFVNNQNSSME